MFGYEEQLFDSRTVKLQIHFYQYFQQLEWEIPVLTLVLKNRSLLPKCLYSHIQLKVDDKPKNVYKLL